MGRKAFPKHIDLNWSGEQIFEWVVKDRERKITNHKRDILLKLAQENLQIAHARWFHNETIILDPTRGNYEGDFWHNPTKRKMTEKMFDWLNMTNYIELDFKHCGIITTYRLSEKGRKLVAHFKRYKQFED
jgi:hypothetical protein